MLQEAHARGFEDIWGVDLDEAALAIVRSKIHGAHTVRADFLEAVVPTTYFDVVCASNTLMYVDDLNAWMNKMRGCLRPGGVLFVKERNMRDLVRRLKGTPCTKLNIFTPVSLRRLLENHGFTDIAVNTGSILRGSHLETNIEGSFSKQLAAWLVGASRLDTVLRAEGLVIAVGRRQDSQA